MPGLALSVWSDKYNRPPPGDGIVISQPIYMEKGNFLRIRLEEWLLSSEQQVWITTYSSFLGRGEQRLVQSASDSLCAVCSKAMGVVDAAGVVFPRPLFTSSTHPCLCPGCGG